MRKLMWFTIGYCAGIAASIWLFDRNTMLIISVILCVAAGLVGLLHSPGLRRRIIATCMFGVVISFLCFHAYAYIKLSAPKSVDGQRIYLTATVTDYSTQSNQGTEASAYVHIKGTKCQIKLRLAECYPLKPGDRVEGEFFLRYTGFGGAKPTAYHHADGITLIAYAGDLFRIKEGDISTFIQLTADLRSGIRSKITKLFPEDTAGFATALLLGDSSGLSTQVDNDFQNSGIRHIIAVSGLHISILIGFLVHMVGKRHRLAAIIGIPILLMFAAVAGFTPSVLRACVMQILLLLAMALDKEYDPATALSFAVLVILGSNPMQMTSVSFQLSVSCVIGIFLFSSKINHYITTRKMFGKFSGKGLIQKLKRWCSSSISISLSAMALTVPLSAYYFGSVCTIGVISNLLTLWVVTYIFCGILLSMLAALLYTKLGIAAAWLISWPMRYVLLISGLLAKIPYASVSAENIYIVAWLMVSYLMILITLCSRNKQPVVLANCILVGLVSAIVLSFMEVRQDSFRMTVLDVGQGQCIILQSGEDCYVVDCGGSSAEAAGDLAASTLQTQGIHQIDGLILTHYDKDHSGGIETLMAQIQVERLLLPDIEPDDPMRKSLEAQYASRIQWIYRKEYLNCGDCWMTLIPAKPELSGNNGCTSILFQTKKCDILITGDLQANGEKALLSSIRLPDIEILVAGHHGADDATSLELLHAVKPEAVVISVGKDNAYGHPDIRTLQRLTLFGCKIWRTDLNGTVIFRG